LTVVLGNAELLEENARLDEQSRERAAIILRAAERGAELTAGLLAFAGKQPLVPKALDTDAALAEVQRLLLRTLPADIALEVLVRDDLWLVEADPAQLNAAILNLAINARDAMLEGGRLLIECSNAHIDEAYVQTDPYARSGDFLRIAVTDSGTGMTPEIAARIFEPYFTTKPRGAGTGHFSPSSRHMRSAASRSPPNRSPEGAP
jgi:signal transduction histidine kinase